MKYADAAIKDAGDRVNIDEEMLKSPWTGEAASGIGVDLAIAATQLDPATTAKEALVLKDNENWSSWKRLWIGRLFGAKPAQMPLSSNCNGREIESKGSI